MAGKNDIGTLSMKLVASATDFEQTIDKEIGGEMKTYRFVRADRMSSREDATSMSLAKGRQLIDEQGDKLFS